MTDPKSSFKLVASYVPGVDSTLPAADYREVVTALCGSSRPQFFMDKIENALSNELKPCAGLFTGAHASGFAFTLVKAETSERQVFMPVVEDKLRNLLLVVGPGPAPDGLPDNVTYINAAAQEIKEAVNEFLASGARERGNQGLLDMEGVHELVGNIYLACKVMAQCPHVEDSKMTLGDVFTEVVAGRAAASAYVTASVPGGSLIRQLRDGAAESFTVRGTLSFKPRG